MKRILPTLFLVYVCLLAPAPSAQATSGNRGKVLVFSDVDDTLKVSYVRNKREMVSFATFTDSLFYGMNWVLQGLAATLGSQHHYVSNGWRPTVEKTHLTLLNDFDFPNKENFHARRLKQVLTRYPHKLTTIVNIAIRENPDVVVLVGDNGEHDPKIYAEVVFALKQYFESINRSIEIHTFIHMVYEPKNKSTLDLYPGQKPFSNAADLALQLAERNLLNRSLAKVIVSDVAEKILREGKNRVYGPLVNPFFKTGPTDVGSLLCRSFYIL